MTILDIADIRVGYDKDIDILFDVSLSIKGNESVALIGSNGAGKSTLLKTISGLIHPKEGIIEYKGSRIDQLEPYQIVNKGILQVPEDGGTFVNLTIEENLNISCLNKKKRQNGLDIVYTFFPALVQKKNDKAGNLSGGQRKMLSIGKAIMGEPKLLLLDDISIGLAPKVAIELYEKLDELTKTLNIPTLVVEQMASVALEFCSRGYVMAQGRIVLNGTSEELSDDAEVKKSYLGI